MFDLDLINPRVIERMLLTSILDWILSWTPFSSVLLVKTLRQPPITIRVRKGSDDQKLV